MRAFTNVISEFTASLVGSIFKSSSFSRHLISSEAFPDTMQMCLNVPVHPGTPGQGNSHLNFQAGTNRVTLTYSHTPKLLLRTRSDPAHGPDSKQGSGMSHQSAVNDLSLDQLSSDQRQE